MPELKIKDKNGVLVPVEDIGARAYADKQLGDIDAIINQIIEIQNALIGGDSE